jgi:hypothetical protein
MNNEQYDKFVELAEEQKRIGKDLVQAAEKLDEYMSYYQATGIAKPFAGMFYSDKEKDNLHTLGVYFSEEICKLHQATKEMNDAYLKIRLDIPDLHQSELKVLRNKALDLQKEIASQEALLRLDKKTTATTGYFKHFVFHLAWWYWCVLGFGSYLSRCTESISALRFLGGEGDLFSREEAKPTRLRAKQGRVTEQPRSASRA